jgi:hypothetical protein
MTPRHTKKASLLIVKCIGQLVQKADSYLGASLFAVFESPPRWVVFRHSNWPEVTVKQKEVA